jgi:hypothetical protein
VAQVAQVVEHLPSKCKALSSAPSITKKKKKNPNQINNKNLSIILNKPELFKSFVAEIKECTGGLGKEVLCVFQNKLRKQNTLTGLLYAPMK